MYEYIYIYIYVYTYIYIYIYIYTHTVIVTCHGRSGPPLLAGCTPPANSTIILVDMYMVHGPGYYDMHMVAQSYLCLLMVQQDFITYTHGYYDMFVDEWATCTCTWSLRVTFADGTQRFRLRNRHSYTHTHRDMMTCTFIDEGAYTHVHTTIYTCRWSLRVTHLCLLMVHRNFACELDAHRSPTHYHDMRGALELLDCVCPSADHVLYAVTADFRRR